MAHSKVWNWNASPVMKNKILSALLIAILAVSWVGVSPEFAVAQDADPGKQKVEKKKDRKKDNDTGGIYKSTDGGESWKRINSLNPRPFYYSQLIVDPSDDRHMYVMGVSFHESHDGGATFKTGGKRVHPDHHALWVNSRDGRRLILGCDGGLYKSYDRGQTWDFHNIMDIGQFYDVGGDNRNPYWVYGGLQDNGSWGGPSRKRGCDGPLNEDWLKIGGGDGFLCRVDPNDPATASSERHCVITWATKPKK